MRTTIIFDSEIDDDSINNIIRDICSYDGEVDLFFSTNGGTNVATTAFIYFLNTQCEDKVRMFFTDMIGSNGVEIFIDFKGEKYITQDLDMIIIHSCSRNINSRNRELLQNFLDIEDEDTKIRLEKYSKFFKFSKKEKEIFKRGEDIVITKHDFNRFSDKISLWQ